MRRHSAYILEDGHQHATSGQVMFQVISARTGRHLSPRFATILEAIEFLEDKLDVEWNGHVEVWGRGGADA